MDEGVDRSACVEVVVFTALQEAQLELAIELVDDRLPSISQFNDLNGHATETTHIYTLCRFVHFTFTGQVQVLPLRTFQIVELSGLGRTWSW